MRTNIYIFELKSVVVFCCCCFFFFFLFFSFILIYTELIFRAFEG